MVETRHVLSLRLQHEIRLLTMLCINILKRYPQGISLHKNFKAIRAEKDKYICSKWVTTRVTPTVYCMFIFLSGGFRGRVTPSSIPNLAVKPPIADNTYPVWIGNVGRCHFEFFSF